MGYIYKITNAVNGKSYIGKTVHEPETGRIRDHLNGYSKGCKALHRAIKKHGKEAFTYEILHQGIIPELLDSFEIEAIKTHETLAPNGYNLLKGGGGCSPSEETRSKMSKAKVGLKLPKETRVKMSKASKGRTPSNLGLLHSKEIRQKVSAIMKGRHCPPEFGRKISKTKRSPYYDLVGDTLFSLPSEMDISEKRQVIYAKFPQFPKHRIRRWIRRWLKRGW